MLLLKRFGVGIAAVAVGVAVMSGTGDASAPGLPAAACCDSHGSISLINAGTNQVIATVHIAGSPNELVVSPTSDSAYVLVLAKSTSRIYKITPGPDAVARPIEVRFSPLAWAVGPAGRFLYLARAQRLGRGGHLIAGRIVPVSTATRKPGRAIPIPSRLPEAVSPMAVSQGGKLLYYSTLNPDAVVPVNLATRRFGHLIRVGSGRFQSTQMLFSPDGRRLYVLGETGSACRLTEINVVTHRVVGWTTIRGHGEDMAITPNGREVYVTSDRGTVTAIRTSRPAVIKTISIENAAAVAVTPNGRSAIVTGFVSGTGAGQLTAISTRTNIAAAPVTVGPDPANGFAISPSGDWAYIFDLNDTVVPVNLVTDEVGDPIRVAPQPPQGSDEGVGGVGFSKDGKVVYVIDLTT